MSTRHLTLGAATFAVLVMMGLAGDAGGAGGPLHRFDAAVQQYVALRNLALGDRPALEVTQDFGRIREEVDARAEAIRHLRAAATQGELFVPEAAPIFRDRIREALAAHGVSASALLAADDDEGATPAATVNGRFLWGTAVATPPSVIEALPPLPVMLQYRFVGADLVLVDIDAALIVDVLPRALELR